MKIALLLFVAFMVADNVIARDTAQVRESEGPYIIGNGVKPPVVLSQPLPAYTEEARQARIEGIVLIQAIIRKDGTVKTFKILRGPGYGLGESAFNTIATK